MILVKKLEFFHLLCLSNIDREKVLLIIFSCEPHSNIHGGRHIVPLGGGGVMAFLFWSGKDSKTGRKRPKKLLHSHFLQSSAR